MISTTSVRNNYVGTGSTATYDFTFPIVAITDLVVITRASGVETLLDEGVDYTVSYVQYASGGSITLTAGNLANGTAIAIFLARPLTQTTDIRNQSAFFSAIHEDAFDNDALVSQQLQDQLNRSVMLSPSYNAPSDFNPQLPTSLPGTASVVFGTDPTGKELVVGPTFAEIASAQSYGAAAEAAAAACGAIAGTGYIAPTDFTIVNNQTAPANVTGLSFSGPTTMSAMIRYWVHRVTTGSGATSLIESGILFANYRPSAGSWDLVQGPSGKDDAGCDFTITSAGQVQYASSNITGTPSISQMQFSAMTMGA